VVAHAHQRLQRAEPIAVPGEPTHVREVHAVLRHRHQLLDGRDRIALRLQLVQHRVTDVREREVDLLALGRTPDAATGQFGREPGPS